MIKMRQAIYGFLSCSSILVMFYSCRNYHRNQSHKNVPVSSIRKGEQLAAKYCQSCHLLPEPSQLNAKSWEEGVLPNMGPYLGIFAYDFKVYPSARKDPNLQPGFYPSRPVLSAVEWQHILDYYSATAPDSLPGQNREMPIRTGLPLFDVEIPISNSFDPTVSYIKIEKRRLLLHDLKSQKLWVYDSSLAVVDSLNSKGSIVDIDFQEDKLLACDIGELNPNNGRFGKLAYVHFDASGKLEQDISVIIKDLARPVQITEADLDVDGKMDLVVCEFGFLNGSLSWFQNMGNGKFQRHVLQPLAGATKVYVQDENKDGLPDLWVLFAQGREGVFLYTNKGKGQFREDEVLRFPPLNGSSFFELVDCDKDGFKDIVYTCGDNADYSKVLKPYHGVYIFLNDGNNRFKQRFFYPINGCYKALARDYDGDGDLDIATISFFADYAHQPEEGFVYFENKGNFKYTPSTFPESKLGRWLTMDAGDLDGNGTIDLVLGNYSGGPQLMTPSSDWKKGPFFILLKSKY
ncbi:VCBS repeat-containing protein [Chitinophagaceae bacterium LB-8]|uniref:VCBS repeat-containing protein n=1 Tax=Paraflavisolibacter caeni TaxID=2982496 RepID=A0A9X2XS95_9BACT|nr:VCBS repeat-containing protein [Paraflavisolibacter caeni]MCU7547916.1 VCBS repeat-containing protein [Paraflavisolibacter caeni]